MKLSWPVLLRRLLLLVLSAYTGFQARDAGQMFFGYLFIGLPLVIFFWVTVRGEYMRIGS
jgi:hypothetical protein